MPQEQLLNRFHSFLTSSSKNTEQFDAELLNAITVDTQLDEILLRSVKDGKNVVIAGTAGSGKTHLLQRLESRLSDWDVSEFGESASSKEHIRTVQDLTAIPTDKQASIFESPDSCRSIVIAANEGALLAAMRDQGSDETLTVFSDAVALLHEIQRGNKAESGGDLVLIDAAGFDPSSNAVLEELISLDVVTELMNSPLVCEDCNDPQTCVRRRTWRQLESAVVRQRVGEIVSAASVNAEGFTFRAIWNFLADLLLGGDCSSTEDSIPTSPWFWRLFNGDSIVSAHISELFPEYRFTIPHAESHLWYGDWHWFRKDDRLLEGLQLVPPNAPPCDITGGNESGLAFRWLKSQVLFLTSSNPFTSGMTTTDASGLWAAAIEDRVSELLQAINKYMLYGFADPGTKLSLWVDYSMEQRTSRPDGQVSLGSVPPDEFEVSRSIAVANSGEDTPPRGARLFLRHRHSGASLSLTREVLGLIAQGRSPRTVDRENTEMDWELMNFFGAVAEESAVPSQLSVALFDFDKRRCDVVNWDVHPDAPRVVLSQ